MKMKAIVILILLIISDVCLSMPSEIISGSKHSNISEQEKAQLSNEWLAYSYTINDVPYEQIKNLLLSDKFSELEKILDDAELEFKRDIRYELKLIHAYEMFSGIAHSKVPGSLEHINKWVSQNKSYQAFAAQAFYYADIAQSFRGGKYISETPKKDLEQAELFWNKAISSFHDSIKINADCFQCYEVLMDVGIPSGNSELAQQAINHALQLRPEAFYIRVNYILYIQPKWGGSYEKARRFVKEAQIYGEKNPRIWSLRGIVPSMEGYQFMLDGDWDRALMKYNEALKYGDKPNWIRNKAFLQYATGDYKGSIQSMMYVSRYTEKEQIPKLQNTVEILKSLEAKNVRPENLTSGEVPLTLESFTD